MQRVIKHLIRIFGNFQISTGKDDLGADILKRVPCRFGDISRQVSSILTNNSENVIQSAPMMVLTVGKLNLSRENVRGPVSHEYVQGINKKDISGNYTNELEGFHEIERINPVPWDLEFNVDIWTTNQKNKFELFEQIATLFAPSVNLQMSENPNDWTSISTVELTNYNYSSRNFPQGGESNLDTSQFTFKTMIWLAVPNKVKRAQIIEQIVTDIRTPGFNDMHIPTLGNWDYLPYDVYTPGNHMISCAHINNNTYKINLLTKYGSNSVDGKKLSWEVLIKYYSHDPSNTQIRLLRSIENSSTEIIGRLQVSTNKDTPYEALLSVDPLSLPATTIDPIKGFIDHSFDFSSINESGRYITINPVNYSAKNLVAAKNSIIEYDKVFDTWSASPPIADLIVQTTAGVRYQFVLDNWSALVSQTYQPGLWRLEFIQ